MKNGYKWRNVSVELGNYHEVHCKKISPKLKAMDEVSNSCWGLYLKRKYICSLSGHGIMTKWYSTLLKNWPIRWNRHLSFK